MLFDVDEIAQKAVAWLDQHWQDAGPCSVCAGTSWIVRAPVQLTPLADPPVPGAVHPVVPLACSTCGNVRLLDAFVAGILPGSAASEG